MATTKEQRSTLARLRASGEWPTPAGGPRIYRIIRFRFNGRKRTIRTGLTLAEAQAHCKDPETSSSTATKSRIRGRWFDGYDTMRGCSE